MAVGDQRYYASNFWHVGYWHADYWGANPTTSVNQVATPSMTLTGQAATAANNVTVSQVSTPTMTMGGEDVTAANDVTVAQVSTPTATLTGQNPSIVSGTVVSQVSTPTMTLTDSTTDVDAAGLFNGDWWATGYWHSGYWAGNYWAKDLEATEFGEKWWHENYWHENYWASTYWARKEISQTTIGEVNQTASPLMTMTGQIATVTVTAQIFTTTPVMTMTAQVSDTANDFTISATAPTMTLSGVNTSADVGENFVGDINVTVFMSSVFGWTDTINTTAPTMTLSGIRADIEENGSTVVGQNARPAMTMSGLNVLILNPITIEPLTPSMTMTGINVDTGYGDLVRAGRDLMAMVPLQTNVSGVNADINEIDATVGAMMLTELTPVLEVTKVGGGDSDSSKVAKRTITPEMHQARRLKREDEEVFLLVSMFTENVNHG